MPFKIAEECNKFSDVKLENLEGTFRLSSRTGEATFNSKEKQRKKMDVNIPIQSQLEEGQNNSLQNRSDLI